MDWGNYSVPLYLATRLHTQHRRLRLICGMVSQPLEATLSSFSQNIEPNTAFWGMFSENHNSYGSVLQESMLFMISIKYSHPWTTNINGWLDASNLLDVEKYKKLYFSVPKVCNNNRAIQLANLWITRLHLTIKIFTSV
jgi:hypothetical protein